MTFKEQLIESIERAIEENARYFYVECYKEGSPASELIINPIENAQDKLNYYEKAYDNNLKLPHAPISIVSFGFFDNISQMEYVRNNFKELN